MQIADDRVVLIHASSQFNAASIYGGSHQVQRNIIAKAVLGL